MKEKKFLIGTTLFVGLAILFFSGVFTPSRGSPVSPEVVTGDGTVKQFSAVISGYAYSPVSIDVNLGDSVVVDITNRDRVTHGISLPSFGVNTSVAPGATKRIQFTADKIGSPETFCSTDHGEKLRINVT